MTACLRWPSLLDLLPGAAPATMRQTVACVTLGCPNQSAGPWRVIGPPSEHYYCARCGREMVVTDGWEEESRADR